MTTTNIEGMVILQAAEDMVLCNGYTKTALGGTVTIGAGSDVTAWVEMTEAEADVLIEANNPDTSDEATEQDYLNALNELGVQTDEESNA